MDCNNQYPQIPPMASSANSTSQADKTALQTAANNAFINGATLAIQTAESLGKFEVVVNSIPGMDHKYILEYFNNLGYLVCLPYSNGFFDPVLLFGEFWAAYWNGLTGDGMPYGYLPSVNEKRPIPYLISWKTSGL